MGFFLSCSASDSSLFIWNPLESEQPRRLSEAKYYIIQTLAFSLDGQFLAAVSQRPLMIWSVEDWVQIYKVNTDIDEISSMNISFFTTKSTNLYENKLLVNYQAEVSSRLVEFAFEESNISVSASEIPTESNEDDMDLK
ncbi:hypothetical protein GHT06_012287 [Daphnia sinensis]|uniref:Uncharacterized protein n=1 Tax=Daphnia sinensis TaxID=1820382 RepID=A0AAD5PVJ6_9CRUS|nr:hypothetical protein GHT06_012287 [Daphnia sinensis]